MGATLEFCICIEECVDIVVQLQDVVRGGEESCDEDEADPVEDRMTGVQEQPAPAQPPPAGGQPAASKGMSRSVSDTTLRKHALHLNLNQSVLPSFTPLHQFKVV